MGPECWLLQAEKYGKVATTSVRVSLPLFLASQHERSPHEESLGFSSPSVLEDSPAVRGTCPLCAGPQDWDAQIVVHHAYSPEGRTHSCGLALPSRSLRGVQVQTG